MKAMRKQYDEEKKSGKQLREAIRHLKGELRLLEESHQKAAVDAGKKRCVARATVLYLRRRLSTLRREYYTQTLAVARERCELLQKAYASRGKQDSVDSRKIETSGAEHGCEDRFEEGGLEALQQKAEQLESQLRLELEKQTTLAAKVKQQRARKAEVEAAIAADKARRREAQAAPEQRVLTRTRSSA